MPEPVTTPFLNVHKALANYEQHSIMHKPLIVCTKEETTGILKHLETAFDDPSTSDVKIQAEGQYIHVHKAILKIRSSFYKKMFQRDWVEKSLSIIKPDQFSYVVYKAFLKYLYIDVIELPWENVLELFALADTYCESNLKKHCIRMIKQGITVSNVAYLYSIAVKHKDEELEEFCFNFAVNHLKDVMRTENFNKLDENTLTTFVIKAAKTGAFSKI